MLLGGQWHTRNCVLDVDLIVVVLVCGLVLVKGVL